MSELNQPNMLPADRPTVIAVTNQKGGVGKTTTAVNLSASLAAMRRRVLLIDLDPQGNASSGSGHYVSADAASMAQLLLGELPVADIVVATKQGYDLLPTDYRLTGAEVRLLQKSRREYQLKQALEAVTLPYDDVIIDCPPVLGVLTVNALVAADAVLVPVQCEYFALEGLSKLMHTIDQIKKTVNPSLAIAGILRTLYDGRNRLAQQVSEQLIQHFGDKVYRTIIPRNVRLAEAPSHGKSVLLYDKHSQGTIAYLALAAEILRRQVQAEHSVLSEQA